MILRLEMLFYFGILSINIVIVMKLNLLFTSKVKGNKLYELLISVLSVS